MTFARRVWTNGEALPAADLNRVEQGVADAHSLIEGGRAMDVARAAAIEYLAEGPVLTGAVIVGDFLYFDRADGSRVSGGRVRAGESLAGALQEASDAVAAAQQARDDAVAAAGAVPTDAALSTTYARKSTSQRVIVIGDSIDQMSDQGSAFWGGSVWSWLAFWTRGRFNLASNVAVGGQATTQMRNRFVADVVDKKPGIVVIGGGRNDLSGGVAAATTRANFEWMVQTALAAKIIPVLHTVAPVDSAGGGAFNSVALNRQGTQDLNVWLKAYAASVGIECIDLWGYWADKATGGWRSGYTSDGVHPAPVAVTAAIHSLRLGGLPRLFNDTVDLPTFYDPTNLWTNPFNLIDSDSNGTPDGWFVTGAPETSFVTGVAFGKMARIMPGPGGELRVVYGPGTTAGAMSTGDVLEFSGRFQSFGTGKLAITLQNQNYQTILTPVSGVIGEVPDGVFRARYTVTEGVTAVRAVPQAQTVVGSWIQLGQMCVRNLTRLGLV